MLGDVLGDPLGVGVHDGDAHPQLPVAELVVEAGQDLVAGGLHQGGVETAVGHRDLGQLAGLGEPLLPLQQLFQLGQHAPRQRYGLPGRVHLDQQSGLHDIDDLPRGDRQDERALLRVEPQQALDLKSQQRLPYRGTRDPDGLGQLAFGQQLAARVTALQYGLFDVGVHALGGRSRTGGRSGRGSGGPGRCDRHAHTLDTTRMPAPLPSDIRTTARSQTWGTKNPARPAAVPPGARGARRAGQLLGLPVETVSLISAFGSCGPCLRGDCDITVPLP